MDGSGSGGKGVRVHPGPLASLARNVAISLDAAPADDSDVKAGEGEKLGFRV
jgi:hypothetical protein